ncbi:hypothetical protein CDAR_462151 [Caerostris darwini]|uniref:Single-pass membrane and coiled-coil domain-containing protein 4 homolog n=1 Tax=Caerostris darwini TaxID=1538125 RepID=A0AAV4RCF3_9ARAC|nr:hypothetical protein CDAR_462151 [Caerostris darwini]
MGKKHIYLLTYVATTNLESKKTMRQLKGKVKESKKEKRERKKDFAENKRRFFTVALPIIILLIAVLLFFIYTNTREKRKIE